MGIWNRVGTVSIAVGSSAVTGVGTAFTASNPGDAIMLPGDTSHTPYEILSIATDTALTIVGTYGGGSNASGASYWIMPLQPINASATLAGRVAGWALQLSGYVQGILSGKFGDGAAGTPSITFASETGTGLRRISAGLLALVIQGADVLKVSSTGLGIGRTPSNLVDAYKSVNGSAVSSVTNDSTGTAATALIGTGNGLNGASLITYGQAYATSGVHRQQGSELQVGGPGGLTLNTTQAAPIYVAINNSQVSMWDGSGRFGMGATPSLWGSSSGSMDIGSVTGLSAFSGSGGATLLSYNGYYDGGNWRYKTTNPLLVYGQGTNGHTFQRAASGTAGTTTAMTTDVTIDINGHLVVGDATAWSGSHTIATAGNGSALSVVTHGTTSVNVLDVVATATGGNVNSLVRAWNNTSTTVFQVAGNGNVVNANNSYGALSDPILKQDFARVTSRIAKVHAYYQNMLTYTMGGRKQIGLVSRAITLPDGSAVEGVNTISPTLVSQQDIGTADEPNLVDVVNHSPMYLEAMFALGEMMDAFASIQQQLGIAPIVTPATTPESTLASTVVAQAAQIASLQSAVAALQAAHLPPSDITV